MTTSAVVALPAGLSSLRDRLCGGTLSALCETRPDGQFEEDRKTLAEANLWHLIDPALTLTNIPGPDRVSVETHIEELAAWLTSDRPVLLALLYSPSALLDRTVAHLNLENANAMDVWLAVGWIAEAVWRTVNNEHIDFTYGPGDRELLRPIAARMRFLVLCEPLRHPAGRNDGWPAINTEPDVDGIAARLFGCDSSHLVIGRCREARRIWQQYLGEYQSHPLLAIGSPRELEREVMTLLFRDATSTAPLVLSFRSERPLAEDVLAIGDGIETHLLPRFRLWPVMRLAQAVTGNRPRHAAPWFTIATVAFALVAVDLVAMHRFACAAGVAAACYAVLGVGVVIFGRTWATQWFLRLPAAGTVGLLVLLTLPPDWWRQPTGSPVAVAGALLVLVGAGYGYLVIEARNHGVGPGASLVRALMMVLIGAVHAFLICLVGLVIVAPLFIDHGADLATQWSSGSASTSVSILLRAVAWCLTAGVFSQILWDDRPITAPLAHLQWRQGR